MIMKEDRHKVCWGKSRRETLGRQTRMRTRVQHTREWHHLQPKTLRHWFCRSSFLYVVQLSHFYSRLYPQNQCLKVLGWRWCHSLVCYVLILILVFPLVFLPSIFSNKCQNWWFVTVTGLDEYSLIPISKVFLMKVSGKRVLFKCINGSTWEGRLWGRYSCLKMLMLEGECTNMEEGLSLEGEIVRYPSVGLSPTLCLLKHNCCFFPYTQKPKYLNEAMYLVTFFSFLHSKYYSWRDS